MAAYDYLIVGAGLYGAVFAHEAMKAGKRVLVINRLGTYQYLDMDDTVRLALDTARKELKES